MTTTGWENINQLVTGSNNQDHTGMEFEFSGWKNILSKKFFQIFFGKMGFSKLKSSLTIEIFFKLAFRVYVYLVQKYIG